MPTARHIQDPSTRSRPWDQHLHGSAASTNRLDTARIPKGMYRAIVLRTLRVRVAELRTGPSLSGCFSNYMACPENCFYNYRGCCPWFLPAFQGDGAYLKPLVRSPPNCQKMLEGPHVYHSSTSGPGPVGPRPIYQPQAYLIPAPSLST